MAGPSDDVLICPACQTRNRARWEYCVRCGESLQDDNQTETLRLRSLDDPQEADSVEEPELTQQDTGDAGTVLLGGVLVLIVLNAVACLYVKDKPAPPPPSPDLFTLGTQPPNPPPPAKNVADRPGARDFEEGRRRLASGDAAGAIPFLTRAAEADSENPAAHDVLGQALAGRNTEAAQAYEQVLAASPDDPLASEGLGRMQYRLGNYAAAAPLLQRASRGRSDDPVLQQELGYALQASGNAQGAIDAYTKVLALQPAASIARGHLAQLLYEQGKPENAIALVQEGVQRDPQAPLLRRKLGSMLEQSGRAQDAAREYREYSRLAPDAPDAKDLAERAARLEGSSGG